MSNRQQEIIAAAAQVFLEKGYHAATTRDIAAAVGIQQASLYYYISSKEELLYLIVREPVMRLAAQIDTIVKAAWPTRQKIERGLQAHLAAFDDNYPHMCRFCPGTPQRHPGPARHPARFPPTLPAVVGRDHPPGHRQRGIARRARCHHDGLDDSWHVQLDVSLVPQGWTPQHGGVSATIRQRHSRWYRGAVRFLSPGLTIVGAKQQGGIRAAKTKGIGHRRAHLHLAGFVGNIVEIALWIVMLIVDRRWQQAMT